MTDQTFTWTKDRNEGYDEWHLFGQGPGGRCAGCVIDWTSHFTAHVGGTILPPAFATAEEARAAVEGELRNDQQQLEDEKHREHAWGAA